MRSHPRRAALAALLALGLAPALAGCLLPDGTPVYVSKQTGNWWSGKGVLTEVSEDGRRCHVAVRDSALVVDREWVDCRYVQERRIR